MMKKRLISIVLIIVMVVSQIPSASTSARLPYRCGDVDSNGIVDINDVMEILLFLANLPNVVKYDASIEDALEILMHLAGLPNSLSSENCACELCFTVPTTTPAPVVTTAPPTTTAPEPDPNAPPTFEDLTGGIANRFCADTLIFTINAEHDDLYGHENGILVEGIDREQWIEEFTAQRGRPPRPGATWDGGEIDPYRPANFNRRGRESEREVFVQMFDHTGQLHISQHAGVRVKGGYSRAHSQKSLELYAREEYGDRNTFLYPFFENEHSLDGNIMNRYRRIRLRNGGSDRDTGFIRDELSQSLFRQAGHPDTQTHVPAAVFVNNEYYGAAWLKSPRTENHLRRKYGGETDNFAIIEGGDNRLTSQWWGGEQHAVDDINEIFALARRGFTGTAGQARFEEFCRRVDLDGLVRYYAMQIYLNNLDWPNHNIEMWRYFPEEGETDLPPNLADGRWRFFSHDLEAGWNIHDPNMVNQDALRGILTGNHGWNGNNSSTFLYYLLERDDMKAKFANTFVDLIEGAFSPENVISTLSDLESKINNEQSYAVRENLFSPHVDGWPTMSSFRDSRNSIRDFANRRPDVIYRSIERNLDFSQDERMAVRLTTGFGGGAMMNSRPISETEIVTANYFSGTSVNLTALPYPGYVFSHWVVNGSRRETETITVSAAATVTVHFEKCPNAILTITQVKATRNDYIIISNDTEYDLSTAGLFLADGSNLRKFEMPDITVESGMSIRVVSRDNDDDEEYDVRVGFNISFGERLSLTDGERILQLVEVSRMSRDGIQIRERDGRWRVIEPEPPEPEIPPHVVQVMLRDPVRWTLFESAPIPITEAGQYRGTIRLPADTDRIISLGIISQGGHFEREQQHWATAVAAHTAFADLRIRIDDVRINGESYGNTFGTQDLIRGGNEVRTGHTSLELWNGWWEPNDRVTGVQRVPIPGDGFALSVGEPISEIEVVFSVVR